LFETRSLCAAQAGLKLMILMPEPSKCWGYRCSPLCPADLGYFFICSCIPSVLLFPDLCYLLWFPIPCRYFILFDLFIHVYLM
jgi:hypothetical protein